MKDFKKSKEKEIITLPLDPEYKKALQALIERLNKLFKKHAVRLCVDIYSFKMELIDEDQAEVGNFFFYPTHKIYDYDGKIEKHVGFRICFVKRIKNNQLKEVSLNLWNETLKKGEWLNEDGLKGFKLDSSRVDVEKLMEATLQLEVRRKVFTSSIGWIQGSSSFHYVPISEYNEDEISCHPNTLQEYKIETLKDLDRTEAFLKISELLNITSKEITIPLLSFTILSSLLTFIKLRNKDSPQFLLSIHGDNGRYKEAVSNLFCNIYNRSSHIYELDSNLHASHSIKSEIPEKASKVKDAIFISRIEKRNDLKIYTKILNQKNLFNGLLLISNDALLHDLVIEIDISNASIDESIFHFHKSNPAVFSTWFDYFIRHTQNTLQDEKWGIGVKSNLDKFHKDCIKMITDKPAEFDPNKLRHYAWLLVGFCFFMNFGLKTRAISVDEFATSTNEAIAIFHKLSAIDLGQEHRNVEMVISQLQKDSLVFLHAIDNLLTDHVLCKFEDRTATDQPELGWISEDKIYLKNEKIFTEVSRYLSVNQVKLISKKADIYQFLYENAIIYEKGKDGWGIQITGSSKAVSYSIQRMKDFLIEDGYELAFLSDK